MPGFEIWGDEEKREVQEVLETGVLFRYGFDGVRGDQWKARTLERELAARMGTKYCHVCSSGTSALSIALAACGVGAGDEVIVPTFTFVATYEAVLMAGAVPVFVDVDETLCLDPGAIDAAITSETKAVVPVHMCGSMAQIDRIVEICETRGVTLIEDTAQAVGATYHGKALGSFGQMGCYSFDAVKTITCGEGGGVVTDDEQLYDRSHQFADHGHDHLGGPDRGADGHPLLGANYRISELNAAVGVAQLRKLDWILATQRRNKSRLKQAMSEFPEVTFRELPDPRGDSATFLSFFLPDAERAAQVTKELGAAGVDACFYWFDNNWHYIKKWDHLHSLQTAGRAPAFQRDRMADWDPDRFEASDRVMSRAISMLIKLSWTDEQIDQRIEAMRDVFGS